MAEELDYRQLMTEALRGMVREVLARTARDGLPGEHHFYITFRTDHPGVAMAPSLRSRHPEEMTIVLQHQFWGLEVEDAGFSVTLRFDRLEQDLYVPFASIVAFADPEAQFALQFAPTSTDEGADTVEEEGPAVTEKGEQKKADGDVVGKVLPFDEFKK